MLYFEVKELLGRGEERDCWLHPNDSNLVIKTTRKIKPDRCQNHQDFLYYQWLVKTGKANVHINPVLGWCMTQHGRGLICARPLNSDGSPCLDLSRSVESGRIELAQALQLVRSTFRIFLEHGITVSDDNPDNFLCVHDGRCLSTMMSVFFMPRG